MNRIFWIAPIVVMAVGVLPLPYIYYTFSKSIVCGCALFYLYKLYIKEKRDTVFLWIFGILAVLYNPILPIYLHSKILWTIVNIGTAIVFIRKRKVVEDK